MSKSVSKRIASKKDYLKRRTLYSIGKHKKNISYNINKLSKNVRFNFKFILGGLT
jgi:hypothetical protein